MCHVKIYAKSAVDLHAKVGAYAFIFDRVGERYGAKYRFQNTVKTLAQADCAAYVNTLHHLSKMAIAGHITELQVYTDSGTVVDLLEIYKAQKHCEDLGKHWREKVKPRFTNLQTIKYVRLDPKQIKAGDNDMLLLQDCAAKAKGELNIMLQIIN